MRRTRPQPPTGFAVGEPIGAGGFASVWSATRDSDDVVVALKVVAHPSELDRARLQREADALAALGPPHTPALIAHGATDDGACYIAMEKLEGDTVADLLESEWPLSVAIMRTLCDSILESVAAAHRAGIVHRDLKPENIIVDRDRRRARLLDFGLAAGSSNGPDELTRTGFIVGTAEYMAPEQIASGEVDTRTDIYAFGVLLYEFLTGRPPFVGSRASIEHGHTTLRPPPPSRLADIPDAVERLVLRCLAKRPSDRPATIDEVRGQLRRSWSDSTSMKVATITKSSLLVGATEPAVVMAVELDDVGVVDSCVRFHGGSVTRRDRSMSICVFPGFGSADPVQAGLAAAAELQGSGAARVALHLASIAIKKRRRGPPRVSGRAVDDVASWSPSQSWSGLLLTEAMVRTGAVGETKPWHCDTNFRQLAGSGGHHVATTLVGRSALLADVRDVGLAVRDANAPALVSIIGDTGSGKSRIAAELTARCQADGFEVHPIRGGAVDADQRVLEALETRASPTAIVLDDSHRLDAETLDAIEFATLDDGARPLLIVAVAEQSLEVARPQWGMRANRYQRIDLEPLDEPAAMALAAELLEPADYPPVEFLRRLVDWSRGTPAVLVGLVVALKDQGIVRRREHGDGWYVSTSDLAQLPPQAAEQWLTVRELSSMAPELAACARVCAVLGDRFLRDELVRVLDASDWAGGASTPMAAGVGIERLVARGVLSAIGPQQVTFTSSAYQRAIYETLDAAERSAIHRSAAELWLDSQHAAPLDAEGLARLARHASAAGLVKVACETHIDLGERALARYRYLDADSQFGAALDSARDDRDRLRCLAGRARARGRLHRTGEALDDARRGRELALRVDDHAVALDLWLVEALIADAAGDYELAAACTASARKAAERHDEPALEARIALAEGRVEWRRGRAADAIPLLRSATAADADVETRIHATLLLAPALVATNALARAEIAFENVIEWCKQTGDRLHECAAYCNRMFLWVAREQIESALEDLRRSIHVARELGNPEPERVGTHNLAELLYWRGDHDEALQYAERGRVLQQRFWKGTPHDALLLARIQLARGASFEAAELLRWIETECDSSSFDSATELLTLMLRLALCGGEPREWDALSARVETELPAEEGIEVACARARLAIERRDFESANRFVELAESKLGDAPIWQPSLRALRARIDSDRDSDRENPGGGFSRTGGENP